MITLAKAVSLVISNNGDIPNSLGFRGKDRRLTGDVPNYLLSKWFKYNDYD